MRLNRNPTRVAPPRLCSLARKTLNVEGTATLKSGASRKRTGFCGSDPTARFPPRGAVPAVRGGLNGGDRPVSADTKASTQRQQQKQKARDKSLGSIPFLILPSLLSLALSPLSSLSPLPLIGMVERESGEGERESDAINGN